MNGEGESSEFADVLLAVAAGLGTAWLFSEWRLALGLTTSSTTTSLRFLYIFDL